MHTHTRPATPHDFPHIDLLLATADMVPAIYATPSRWWVTVASDGTVLAAVGVEPGPATWLLRSCVVAPAVRRSGLGAGLVDTVSAAASACGITTLVCFGTDVGDYWERRGFARISVAELCALVPDAPQIGQFTANGWLQDELAWRKDL